MAMEHPGEPPNSTTPLFSSNEIDMTEFGYERKDLEKFCSEQIRIPPKLPNILKTFTKAAMRTQPRDLVHWTGAYFRALAEGQVPPVKETLEYPQVESKDGLTVGYLRVLNNQVGGRDIKTFSKLKVKVEDIRAKWIALCLPLEAFDTMLRTGKMFEKMEVDWKKLLGVLCGSIGKNLTDTMKIVCEVLTEQPEGVDAMIPYMHFWEIYAFLVKVDGSVTHQQMAAVNEFLMIRAQPNFCLIGPKDFLDPGCPPLY
ncbi:ropporin-1-like protein isoform X2 [Folsomia candida]|uniref:ropporin-1-like protein isoform X2 n=1 Tax=Folsomia candida TaxID=158441 RepID=UPI000B905000|nr:ropporin-1-like protein isoform X2 [Folsomia candida]